MKHSNRKELLRRFVTFYRTQNPQVLKDLKTNHKITKDIRKNIIENPHWFVLKRMLSEKQISLLRKLASVVPDGNKTEIPAEMLEGRNVINAEVVNVKWKDDTYFAGWKMTLKVNAGNGKYYMLWGSVPETVYSHFSRNIARPEWLTEFETPEHTPSYEYGQHDFDEFMKGKKIKINASVKRSDNDPAFGFYSRPSKVKSSEIFDVYVERK